MCVQNFGKIFYYSKRILRILFENLRKTKLKILAYSIEYWNSKLD